MTTGGEPLEIPEPTPIREFAVTNGMVLSIAVPMTLAYLTTPLLGIVDTAVVGQLGDAALLGGLAVGALAFDVVFSSFNFLRAGTTGLVAQAMGREDRVEQQAVFWRAFAIALTAGLLLILTAPLIVAATRWFVDPEARVAEAMEIYVAIRVIAAPLTLINYAVLGYVLGRGEGSVGLLLQVVLNGGNVFFSIWLGMVLGWGVEGVAWGTVLGETLGLLAGMAVLLPRFRRAGPVPRSRLVDLPAFRAMLAVNRDIMIRSFVLLGAFALLVRQGAQFGTVTLAANAVLMNLYLLAGYFLDGFATAAEQLAGRAVGARYAPAFHRAVRLTAWWGFGLAFVCASFFLAFGPSLVALMTTASEVRVVALEYLPWAALTAVSGVLAFQMDGVFIGATWSRDMRNMMLLSFALYVAALWSLGGVFGNHGIWAALHIFLIARGLSLLAVMRVRARETFGH
jgi:multidrug resistance protein, MATE family